VGLLLVVSMRGKPRDLEEATPRAAAARSAQGNTGVEGMGDPPNGYALSTRQHGG
jgi:hypothetical protein